jgi:hypothetical protein
MMNQYSYKPSKRKKDLWKEEGDEVPLIYIPRKPHPVGLMTYIAAIKTENKNPFIINVDVLIVCPQLLIFIKKIFFVFFLLHQIYYTVIFFFLIIFFFLFFF